MTDGNNHDVYDSMDGGLTCHNHDRRCWRPAAGWIAGDCAVYGYTDGDLLVLADGATLPMSFKKLERHVSALVI